jgi:hypothetical protein
VALVRASASGRSVQVTWIIAPVAEALARSRCRNGRPGLAHLHVAEALGRSQCGKRSPRSRKIGRCLAALFRASASGKYVQAEARMNRAVGGSSRGNRNGSKRWLS